MGLCWKRGMERQDIVFIQGQDQKTFSFSKHLNHKYNNSRNILLIQICRPYEKAFKSINSFTYTWACK